MSQEMKLSIWQTIMVNGGGQDPEGSAESANKVYEALFSSGVKTATDPVPPSGGGPGEEHGNH